MKWRADQGETSTGIDRVAVGLREYFTVDDDGIFETPGDLDPQVRRRLEEAGHTPLEEIEQEDGEDVAPDEDGDDGSSEQPDRADQGGSVDDEYADMDRSELYEEYKERGGPLSWNETTEGDLREALRINDEHGTFPTEG